MSGTKKKDKSLLQKDALKKMILEEFLTNEEIAERTGYGKRTINTALRRAGLGSEKVRMLRRVGQARRRKRR